MSKQNDHDGAQCRSAHRGISHKQFLLREHWSLTPDCNLFHPKITHFAYRNEAVRGDHLKLPPAPSPGISGLEEVYHNHMYQLGVMIFDSYVNLFGEDNEYFTNPINNPLDGLEDVIAQGDEKEWEWSIREIHFSNRIPNGKLAPLTDWPPEDHEHEDNEIFWHLINDKFKSESYAAAMRQPGLLPHMDSDLEDIYAGNQHLVGTDDESISRLRSRTVEALRLAHQDAIISQLEALRTGFFTSVAIVLMHRYPHLIPSDVKFSWGEIFNVLTLDELRDIAIQKFMDDKFWRKGLKGELDWLTTIGVNQKFLDPHTLKRVGETAVLRHAIAHSSSTVNESTFRRAPTLQAVFDDGDRIDISVSNLRCLMRSHLNLFALVTHQISVEHKVPIMSPLRTTSCDCEDAYRPSDT
jgi:hypothetical protein